MPPELARTPLYENHVRLKARLVPFAGYEMPVQYSGVLEETKAVRTAAGLFDVSHMGQFSVRGTGALAEVQKLVTNDLTKLSLGQAQYNLLCNAEGGIIDDLVIYRRAEDHIYICVNASNRSADYAWMKSRLAAGVKLTDESDATSLLALQGPLAETIIAEHAEDPSAVRNLKYYWATEAKVFGRPCYLSRTGYTGEDGFELYVANEHASYLWDAILEAGRARGVLPIGLGARDTLRIEMGYPLHGHEISTTISPLSAGLNWVVKLARPTPFTGQDALKKEAERGPDRVLRAFVVEDRRIARQGYVITDESKRKVGEITSGTHSPHVGSPVALGFVDKSAATAEKLFVEVRGAYVPARIVKLPFVPSKTKKNTKPAT